MSLQKTTRLAQRGFTLVELAIIILIVSFIIIGAIGMLKPYVESTQRSSTQQKLEKISLALADFAQSHGRLPCPADPNEAVVTEPFGAPRNSGVLGDQVTNPCQSAVTPGGAMGNFIGIVPFRALGLGQDAVRDGYGHYITYAASPVVTGSDTSPYAANQVHQQCRQAFWMDPATNTNLNTTRALLCCPPPDAGPQLNDITILDAAVGGNPVFSGTHSATAGEYADVNTLWAAAPANANTTLIAFALISHGRDGFGAYNGVGNQQIQGNNFASGDQNENADGDTVFISHPIITREDATYFDDLVYWRTNAQLLSAFGNASCARP